MSINQALGYEHCSVIACIDPDAYGTGAVDSDEIDMSKFNAVMAIVMAGTLGSSATLDFKFQGATAEGGAYGDISGKSITQLTQAGTDSDKQAIVFLRGEDMDTGDRWVKGVMTVGTATSDCGVVILGWPKYLPATDFDLSSVDEVVN